MRFLHVFAAIAATAAMACSAPAAHETGTSSQGGAAPSKVAATNAAPKFGAPAGMDKRPDGMVLRPFFDADLTLAQKVALIDAQRRVDEQRRELHAQMKAQSSAVRAAVSAGPAAGLHGIVDEKLAAYGKIAHAAADAALAIDATLTDAQRAALLTHGQAANYGTAEVQWKGIGGPDVLVVRVFHPSAMGPDSARLLGALHDDLHAQRLEVTRAIDGSRPALLAALAAPAPDAQKVHAIVSQVLAGYGQAAHSMADRGLGLQTHLSANERASLAL